MTSGLTKYGRTEWVPAIPAVPAIPPMPAQYWLAPPPPGYYYSGATGSWTLKKYTPPLRTSTGGSDGSYTLPGNSGGIVLRAGDQYRAVYEKDGEPDAVFVGTVPAGPFSLPGPTTPGWTLKSITITPASASGTTSPSDLTNVPAPAGAIQFLGTPRYSNGYPVGPGPYTGIFPVPNPAGGYTYVSRTYTKTGPNGLFVPAPGVDDPPGVTTQPAGVRAVLVAAFAGAPAVPAVPGYSVEVDSRGWNAGANSIAELDGDVYVKFQVPFALGARVGFFTGGTREADDLDALLAGFYVYSDQSGARWTIFDHGRQVVLADNDHEAAAYYEIRRISGQVTYYVDDTQVYRSPNTLEGALRVGTTLYAPGDMVL